MIGAVIAAVLALLGLAVAVRRVAVLGGICAAAALGLAVFALVTGTSAAALAALALLGLGAGVTVVGEIVWRGLADEEGDPDP